MILNDRIRPELFDRSNLAELNPLLAQISHLPFPEVAAALRSSAEEITKAWDAAVRLAMPQMRHLSFDEMKDSTPQILNAIADAMASDDPVLIHELLAFAPKQGLSRLRLNYDVVEIMQEDRLLRAIVVIHVEAALRRPMAVLEAAALHADIDLMLQRSVIAMVDEQKLALRAAAETELKFLSFLAHDMNNNLNNVNLLLGMHAVDLEESGASPTALDSLRQAQRSIGDTVTGMRQMLDSERMKNAGAGPVLTRVDLNELAVHIATPFRPAATMKGIKIAVDMDRDTIVQSSEELITLVLQNLLGNSLKYSKGGTVRIGCGPHGRGVGADEPFRQTVWVSDEGDGIAADKLGDIFEAFKRGDVRGQWGVGLGLAIASQGAKLLGAELTVESKLGTGSIFRLIFPAVVDELQAANVNKMHQILNESEGLSVAAD